MRKESAGKIQAGPICVVDRLVMMPSGPLCFSFPPFYPTAIAILSSPVGRYSGCRPTQDGLDGIKRSTAVEQQDGLKEEKRKRKRIDSNKNRKEENKSKRWKWSFISTTTIGFGGPACWPLQKLGRDRGRDRGRGISNSHRLYQHQSLEMLALVLTLSLSLA